MMKTPTIRWRKYVPTDDVVDDLFLEALYIAVHRLDFAACALDEEQLHSLLRMQARAQRLGYRRDFPQAVDRIILPPDQHSAKPIGRLLVAYDHDAIRLIDIALLPTVQRQGVGTALLHTLIAEAQAASLPLRLSVRPENPALQLYERLGFHVLSRGVQIEMEHSSKINRQPHPAVTSPSDSLSHTAEPLGETLSHVMERLTGCYFSVHMEPTSNLSEPFEPLPELVLTSVQRFGAPAGDSFTLIFQGPLELILPQAIYQLRALPRLKAGMTAREPEHAIFLVPVGPRNGAMQYEAIFNR